MSPHQQDSLKIYNNTNFTTWMLMAFQAGVLNVGGFMACHQFVSHVTGYATLFGVEFLNKDFQSAFTLLTVPLFFMVGSMISAYFTDLRLISQKEPKYYLVYAIMFVLQIVVVVLGLHGTFGAFGEPLVLARDYSLMIILCLACGMQNATITSSSGAVVRTTHLTGVTTDLGLGLVRYLNRNHTHQSAPENKANVMRFGIILFFILGSLLGALIFSKFEFAAFLVPALISAFLFFKTLKYGKIIIIKKD